MPGPATVRRTQVRRRRWVSRAAGRDAMGTRSCGFEIRLPRIEGDSIALPRLRPPEFHSIEHNCVEPLRILAKILSMRVGKHVYAEYSFNDSCPAAKIAGQPCVMLGRRRSHAYSLAGRVACGAR